MNKRTAMKSASALLIIAALSPWAGIPLFPEYAFAQTTVQAPAGSPLANQAARQNNQVTITQAAASGAISIGACLAAAGISLGSAIGSVLSSLGLTTVVAAAPAAASGAAGGAAAAATAAAGLPVPVLDGSVNAQLVALNTTAGLILKAQGATLIQVGAMQNKESVLDCVAWALAKMIWRSIAASIIDWINSGFNGSPTFVQDFGRFFRNIGDEAIGQIIESDQYLAFLCSPFQFQIRLALAMRFARRAPTCTLSQVIENVENFAKSFQSGGGWPAWLQYFVVPNNNPYGSYIISEATVGFYYQTKLGQQKFELSLTRGFLNQKEKVCSNYPKAGGGTEERCREITVTPGELIAQKAGQIIGSGETQLLLADEFNEIIDALVVQLLSKALNSFSGLSSSSSYQDSYYGGSSAFTRQLGGTEQTSGDTGVNATTSDYGLELNDALPIIIERLPEGYVPTNPYVGDDGSLVRQIDEAISQERSYQALNQRGVNLYEDVISRFSQVSACWSSKAAGTSTPPVNDPGDRNQAGIEGRTVDLTIEAIRKNQKPFTEAVAQGDTNIAALNTLIARAASASTQADLAAVLRDLNAARAQEAYVQPTDYITTSAAVTTLEALVPGYDSQIEAGATRCQYFPDPVPSS